MKRPEQDLQKMCVKWFRHQYPKAIIHHSPNGGWRTKTEGAILKAMGVMAGFPDLIILHKGRVCFFELKSVGGKPTANQDAFYKWLRANDFGVWTIYSFDDFKDTVDLFMKGLEI